MSNWRWESAHYLNLLWLLPIIFIISKIWLKRVQNTFTKKLGAKTAPVLTASVSINKRKLKEYLQLIALGFLVIAYARPQSGEGHQTVKNEGIEIVFLVDVSNSMLAEDVKPSRLDFAKSELARLVDMSGGDRMSIVAFAGSPATLTPLTTDQDAIKMYLESLSPDSVSTQGTNFQKALDDAQEVFKRGGFGEQEGVHVTQAIVIASDGEDLEPGANEAAERLAKAGIHIFTIAFGTEEGAAIPIRDDSGQVRGYKKDKSGQAVTTKVTGQVLRDLARIGQGSFHHATYQGDVIKEIHSDIDKMQKAQFESGEIKIFSEYFQTPLVIALAIAILEIWLGERKSTGRLWRGRFEVARD